MWVNKIKTDTLLFCLEIRSSNNNAHNEYTVPILYLYTYPAQLALI